MGITFFASDSLQLDDGVYDAQLTNINEVQTEEAEPRTYARWEFMVFTDEYPEGAKLTANSSLSFGPKSKARKWLSAALGRPIEGGEALATDSMLPLSCRVLVKLDESSGFLKIEDVLKARQKQGQQPVDEPDDLFDDIPEPDLFANKGWAPIFKAMADVGVSNEDLETYFLSRPMRDGSKPTSMKQLGDGVINRFKDVVTSEAKAKDLAIEVRRVLSKAEAKGDGDEC